jgi:hypothetical protein
MAESQARHRGGIIMTAVFDFHFSRLAPTTMPAPGYSKFNEHFNRNPDAKRGRDQR